eukprot:4408311-Amphidinium_carterae.2
MNQSRGCVRAPFCSHNRHKRTDRFQCKPSDVAMFWLRAQARLNTWKRHVPARVMEAFKSIEVARLPIRPSSQKEHLINIYDPGKYWAERLSQVLYSLALEPSLLHL